MSFFYSKRGGQEITRSECEPNDPLFGSKVHNRGYLSKSIVWSDEIWIIGGNGAFMSL